MPMFPRDFLAATEGLSAVDGWAYTRLLLHAWLEHGYLQDDPAELARLAKVTPIEWVATWARLARFWDVADGKLSQRRQLYELEQARQNRTKAREVAQQAAEARWSREKASPAAKRKRVTRGTMPAQCPSPSPSSPPSPAPAPRSGGGAAPSRLPTDLDIALVAFAAAWKRRYRQDYVATATDRSQLGRLLRSLTPEQARALPACFAHYLADISEFVATEKRHSLAWFLRDDGYNKYRTSVPAASAKERKTAAALGRFLETGGGE
jgi:uncharacterized protein YdaU (DUF1376 family)